MPSTPKISVIIPTYNRADYLPNAIDSVLKQTYTDYELIIIDDGSTDKTRALIEQYGEKIRYYYKENGGDASARNEGIRKAKGKYVAFLDSDDIWFPMKLQCQIEAMEKRDVTLVHTGRWEIDLKGEVPPFRGPKVPAKNSAEFLSGDTHISMTVLVKRDALMEAGMFDEYLDTTSDTDMWLRLAFDHEFAYVDEPLMTFRMHSSNISRKMEQKYGARYRIAEKMCQNDDPRISKLNWKKRMAMNSYLQGIEKYKNQRYAESRDLILRALTMDFLVGKSNIYIQDPRLMKIKKFFAPAYFLVRGGIREIRSGGVKS